MTLTLHFCNFAVFVNNVKTSNFTNDFHNQTTLVKWSSTNTFYLPLTLNKSLITKIKVYSKYTKVDTVGYQKISTRGAKMERANESIVYWMLLGRGPWTMYIAATTEGLCYVGSQHGPFEELANWVRKRLPAYELSEDENVMKPYATELMDYLEGRRTEFTLSMDLHGTAFQQAVWKVLQQIPYGQTVSYTDIAQQIKKPNAVRAVGTAIGSNPLLITVPCHRVISKNGKLTGYRGGLEMKEQLLGLEK